VPPRQFRRESCTILRSSGNVRRTYMRKVSGPPQRRPQPPSRWLRPASYPPLELPPELEVELLPELEEPPEEQSMPKRQEPLLEPPPRRPPELLPDPDLPPPLDPPLEDPPPPPAHRPPWHVCPAWVQSSQAVPPFPHAVSSALVSQLPLVSQHPAHEVGSQVPEFAVVLPELPSSPPVVTPELSPEE
jgi:hypothetical protein